MSRPSIRYVLAATVSLALGAAALPAAAAVSGEARAGGADPRKTSPGRVVDEIVIGVLGSSTPVVERSREVAPRKIAEGAMLDVEVPMSDMGVDDGVRRCYWARPTRRHYNGFGKLSTKSWYYIEWCGRGGRVTRVLTLYCGGVAAQGFSYDGCRVRRGATGYGRLNVSAGWVFPFRVGVYTVLSRTVTVSARHHATGRYAGTWWLHQ